jgi:hypothetical protein
MIMKLCRLSNCIPVAVVAALLPLGIAISHAVPAPASLEANDAALQQAHPKPVDWENGKKHKLRHAYWLLDQSDRDYDGHRVKAMEEIRKAGDLIGMDLHGEGYSGEKQKWSDKRLREARGLLKDIVDKTGEREHIHIRAAIHELDRALEIR